MSLSRARRRLIVKEIDILFLLVILYISRSEGLVTKRLPKCLVGEVGTAVWFNFTTHESADLYRRSRDTCKSEGVYLLVDGECGARVNCTYMSGTNYPLLMLNVSPTDSGTYVAKDANGLYGKDNCSTELIVYGKYRLPNDSLSYAIDGHIHNATISCAGSSGTVHSQTANHQELQVQVPRDSMVNCTLTVHTRSICNAEQFECSWWEMVNTSSLNEGESHDDPMTGTQHWSSLSTVIPTVPGPTAARTNSADKFSICRIVAIVMVVLGILVVDRQR